MKNYIFFIITSFLVLPAFGQNNDKMWNPYKTKWIDTTRTEILFVRAMTDKSLDEDRNDIYILEIGRRNLHFRPYSEFLEDSVYKELDTLRTTIGELMQTYIPNKTPNINISRLQTDLKRKEVKESCLALLNTVSYTEPLEKIKWNLIDTTKIYKGHKCRKATAEFRGRKWIAWYTEEIPVSYGPWKFSGLPGLILQAATDDMAIHLFAVSIRNGGNPMGIKEIPEEKMDRKSFLEFFRKFNKEGGMGEAIMRVAPPMPGQGITKPPFRELFYVPMETDY